MKTFNEWFKTRHPENYELALSGNAQASYFMHEMAAAWRVGQRQVSIDIKGDTLSLNGFDIEVQLMDEQYAISKNNEGVECKSTLQEAIRYCRSNKP